MRMKQSRCRERNTRGRKRDYIRALERKFNLDGKKASLCTKTNRNDVNKVLAKLAPRSTNSEKDVIRGREQKFNLNIRART